MVQGGKTYVGEDEEDFCLVWVSDPHLGAIEYPVISFFLGACFESEGIWARWGFGETKWAELYKKQVIKFFCSCKGGQVLTLDWDSWGNHFSCCSWVPYLRMTVLTRVLWTSQRTETDGSTFASSSMAMMAEVKEEPDPPKSGLVSMPMSWNEDNMRRIIGMNAPE